VPVAVLSTDPDIGPLARSAIARAIAGALPGWTLDRAAREGAISAADAQRADAVIVAGGPLGLDDGRAARRAGVAARLLDRPLVHLDVRGPGASQRRARALVRDADLLVVRGHGSAARLAATGAAAPFRVGAPLLWAASPQLDDRRAPRTRLLAALRAPGDPERIAMVLRRAAARAGAGLALASWRTSRAPAADLALTRAVAERVTEAELLPTPDDHAGCVRQAATASAVYAQDTAAAVATLAAGSPLVVETADPDIAVFAQRCGQQVAGPGQDPREVGDLFAAVSAGAPPPRQRITAERGGARATLALLRLVCERGRAPGAPPLPLAPWPEARRA